MKTIHDRIVLVCKLYDKIDAEKASSLARVCALCRDATHWSDYFDQHNTCVRPQLA
jgi:hypothetical protein